MNHNHNIARYCLTASAFVLAGLLFTAVYWRGGVDRTAEASMVAAADTITLMTAQTRPGEEAVFVLDTVNEALLIYTLRLRGNNGVLELSERRNLADIFRGNRRSDR